MNKDVLFIWLIFFIGILFNCLFHYCRINNKTDKIFEKNLYEFVKKYFGIKVLNIFKQFI